MQIRVQRRNRTDYALSTEWEIANASRTFEQVYTRDVYRETETDFLTHAIESFIVKASEEKAVQEAEIEEILPGFEKVYNYEDGNISEVTD